MKVELDQNQEYDIIKKCLKGDRNAFKWLYEENCNWLFAVCLRYVSNREDAEDVLQESFIQIYRKLETFQFQGSFKGWMRKVTVNTALATFRKNQIDFTESTSALYFETAEDTELLDQLDSEELKYLIDKLSPGRKQIFMAYAIDGYKHTEIAEMLNISEGTSKSQLFDARKELVNAIKKDFVIAKKSL